jgi:hypothetical protein
MLNHLSLQSQNLDLYGMRGNPMTLGQNPGAQTDLKLHVSLPGLTSQGNLTTPLGELRGDYGANLRNLEAPNVGISSATDIELVGLGWEGKKSYTWVQTGIDVDARFHLDKDLVLFGFYGMTDGTNAINPNYVGDFSATGMSMSAMGRLALGHQRVLNDQLRLGASVQVNRLLGGLQWEVEDWAMRSQWDTINQTNSLTWSSDMQVSAFGLIADGAQLDSAMDFPRYLIMGMVPAYWSMLRAQKNSYSLNMGATYTPTSTLTLTASVTGIPLYRGGKTGRVLNSRALNWNSNFTYDGFTTGFSPQDTGTWVYYLTHLQAQALNDFSIESAPPARFSAPFIVQVAAYYSLRKNHRLGVHISHIDRLAGLHQAVGVEYQGFLGRGLQVAAAYRLHRWDGLDGASEVSTLVQNRIFPWTTLYVGSNLWLSTPAIQQGRILFPANFQSWQVTAGVNVTLFEKRFKDEKRERKEAKKQARSAKVLNSGTAELNPLKLQDHSDLLSDTINEEGDGE